MISTAVSIILSKIFFGSIWGVGGRNSNVGWQINFIDSWRKLASVRANALFPAQLAFTHIDSRPPKGNLSNNESVHYFRFYFQCVYKGILLLSVLFAQMITDMQALFECSLGVIRTHFLSC